MSSKVSAPEPTWCRGQRQTITPTAPGPSFTVPFSQGFGTHKEGPREGDGQASLIPAHVQAAQGILGISCGKKQSQVALNILPFLLGSNPPPLPYCSPRPRSQRW